MIRDPSIYGRMMQSREERGSPRTIESMKEVGWEHQAEAIAHGYPSVLHWAIDLLVERTKELEGRLEAAEKTIRAWDPHAEIEREVGR